MAKKLVIVAALGAIAVIVLYQVVGVRVQVDGSGLIPRFVAGGPDYDALEADRARQRQVSPSLTETAGTIEQPTATTSPVPATTTAEPSAASPRTTSGGTRETRSDDWPDFRGRARDGRYAGGAIRM